MCRHRGAGAPRRGRGSASRPATALRAAEGRSTLAGSRLLRAGAPSFERAPPASSGRPGRVPRFERADAAGDSLSEMSASKGETTNLISESLNYGPRHAVVQTSPPSDRRARQPTGLEGSPSDRRREGSIGSHRASALGGWSGPPGRGVRRAGRGGRGCGGSEGRSDKGRIFVAGGLERGRKGLREGSQKKNGAELPRVPATRGLEGSEGFRGLEGCRPAAAHGRGSTGDGARDRGTGDGE